jgi:Arc/MetJ family transcription regulator
MKQATITLDEDLLEEVVRVSGEKSQFQAVSRALEEYLQRHRPRRRILDLAGTGLWEGDLAEMREDQQVSRPDPRSRAPR